MKIRCNQCMSVFFEQFINLKDEEKCPVCGERGCLMDVPPEEFPQYYEDRPIDIQNQEKAIHKIEKVFDSLTIENFSEILERLDDLGFLARTPDEHGYYRCAVDIGDMVVVFLNIDFEKETINIVRR